MVLIFVEPVLILIWLALILDEITLILVETALILSEPALILVWSVCLTQDIYITRLNSIKFKYRLEFTLADNLTDCTKISVTNKSLQKLR